jgi:hypothetical protein
MKRIPLTQGLFALVDDEDYDRILSYHPRWHTHNGPYTNYAAAVTSSRYMMLMHRLILSTPFDMVVDHLDGDGLNNQRYNIRNVTHQANDGNRHRQKNNTSGKIGVNSPYPGSWQAYIHRSGKKHHLGSFSTFDEAVAARIAAEQESK